MEINPFVLDRTPQSLDKDIIPPSTAPVHTKLAALIFHGIDKRLDGELAALIGVDDFRRSVLPECLLQYIHRMTREMAPKI